MNKILWAGLFIFLMACSDSERSKEDTGPQVYPSGLNPAITARVPFLVGYPIDSTGFPRRFEKDGQVIGVPSKDWTSGFFPGSLFYLSQLMGDTKYQHKAEEWLPYLEKEKFNDRTHDMGFKINCSFGNAYKLSQNPKEAEVMVKSAKTLSTRFNQNVGCIKSWDFGKDQWTFPVIIDNMMNLELLFEATILSGDSSFHQIAVSHAQKTMEHHFRPDYSSYHVVDYDPESGEVVNKLTHQGYNAESIWSRGQAWGLYGFTMAYRYTGNTDFLDQAVSIARFMMTHPNLAEDKVPYWDMLDPAIPNAPRDASAAAIMASACLELYKYTKDDKHRQFGEDMLKSLSSDNYVLKNTVEAPFILDHSTGNWPKKEALDVPIAYADYYFLEALKRKADLDIN